MFDFFIIFCYVKKDHKRLHSKKATLRLKKDKNLKLTTKKILNKL